MCRLGEYLIKYVLIISNIIFSIAGIAVMGLGIAAHIQVQQITDLIPVNFSYFSISIIVLGCVVFFIAYLACCGAIRQSMCMLITYSIFMMILAAVKIYIVVVVFNFLDTAETTVGDWITNAFNDQSLRPQYHFMEQLFSCCGTTGPSSYPDVIPYSCCGNPVDVACNGPDSFDGCFTIVSSWFQSFGSYIGGVLITVIVVELVCALFGLHVTNTIRNKRKNTA